MENSGKEEVIELGCRRSTGADRGALCGPVGTDNSSHSGPISGPIVNKKGGTNKSARFNIPEKSPNPSENDDEDLVEITIDVRDDSVAVHSVKPATGGGSEHDDRDVVLFAKTLEQRSSLGSLFRTASFRIKQVSHELKKLTSGALRQGPSRRFDRSKSAAVHALNGLKFITQTDGASGWPEVEKKFDELSTGGVLPKNLFGQCIGMKESKEFAGELFDALARRRNIVTNSINKYELKEFWDQISDENFDSRLQTFFDMVDKKADGRIGESEVREIITLSASANRLSRIQDKADEYAALIMEELDPNNLGYIEVYNLEMLLLRGPSYETIRTENSKILSQKLSQKLKPTKEPNPIKRWIKSTHYFLEDNWKRVWILTLWIMINCGLFTWKFIQYRNRAVFDVMGYCVCVAKGGAEMTKFNMALILLPVCRKTITWLRNKTNLAVLVPFDDNLSFHMTIAVGVTIGILLHAISHLTCDFPRLLHASDNSYSPMRPFFGETKPPDYWWFVKGTEGWTGVVMVVLMAIAFVLATPWVRNGRFKLPNPVRKLTGFNAFWYSHHLFVIVYALLVVHGWFLYLSKEWYKKTTWMYLAVPVLLYGTERLVKSFWSRIRRVKIVKVAVYPGNVLAIYVSKPSGFKYKSGQYVFVNCAKVSPFEWHPFSITSAPGEDYLSVHIRVKGDWTGKLKDVFSKVGEPPAAGNSGKLRAELDGNGEVSKLNFPKILIDGPYGAPTQDYKDYDVVLLIGLGIGATPFISVVKDILHNLKKKQQHQQQQEEDDQLGSPEFKTQRAYFYWVTREQDSFDWFRGVMNEVAERDRNGVIELHNYCSSVYERGDARSAIIAFIQSVNLEKNGVDVVTGTRVVSHFAKPKWRKVFKKIALNHRDQRIGVFYCGQPGLMKELRLLAQDFSRKTTTKFDFHKENF